MSENKVTSTTYQKTLSQAEAIDKKIIITKQALKLFPKPWKDFTLSVGNEKFSTHIESESCTCMGPQKPHEHYWLRDEKTKQLLEWKIGSKLKFEKTTEKEFKLEQIK